MWQRPGAPGFDAVRFEYMALPEMHLDEIDPSRRHPKRSRRGEGNSGPEPILSGKRPGTGFALRAAAELRSSGAENLPQ
jgi:hypothetical protein